MKALSTSDRLGFTVISRTDQLSLLAAMRHELVPAASIRNGIWPGSLQRSASGKFGRNHEACGVAVNTLDRRT